MVLYHFSTTSFYLFFPGQKSEIMNDDDESTALATSNSRMNPSDDTDVRDMDEDNNQIRVSLPASATGNGGRSCSVSKFPFPRFVISLSNRSWAEEDDGSLRMYTLSCWRFNIQNMFSSRNFLYLPLKIC